MRRSLALDTSTDWLSLALFEDGILRASQQLRSQRRHGELLVDQIQHLLQAMNWEPQDLQAIYVGIGPGSYTGMRMGVTLAKTWAVFADLEVYAFSSLELLVASAPLKAGQRVIGLEDARRLACYLGVFEAAADGQIRRLEADQYSDWKDYLADLQGGFDALLGQAGLEDFQLAYEEVVGEAIELIEAVPDVSHLPLISHQLVEDPHLLAPFYGHATLAEQEWAQKEATEVANEVDNASFIDFHS